MDTGPNPQPTRQSAPQPLVQPEVVSSGSAAASPAPTIIIQQSGGRLTRLFSWLGWAGLLFCIPLLLGMYAGFHEYFDTTGGIQERYHSLARYGTNKIAVLNIEGVIMDGDGFVKRQIDRVTNDDSIKAVVIRIDSPGGTVNGSDFIYHHLKKLRQTKSIPMVVSMGGMAASGGYYIAMAVGDQERSIFAEPTTTTGSIGVIIPHYDLSGLLQRFDIKNDSIASHPRKQMLSMTKETSAEDREILQRYVNESFARFKEIVRSGRPAFERDQEALDQLATGEIFSAQQAKEHGLVDEIGFVEDAIDRAIELAQLPRDTVRVVNYRRMPNLFSVLGYHQAQAHPLETLGRELAMPRAFYLATTWPAFIRSDSP